MNRVEVYGLTLSMLTIFSLSIESLFNKATLSPDLALLVGNLMLSFVFYGTVWSHNE